MNMVDLAQDAVADLANNKDSYLDPPGHPAAVLSGCKCPTVDNGHGKGSGQIDDNGLPLYWINVDCPYHVKQ